MSNPILYILMRNDLPSMNHGKAMAQASHASNAFVKHAREHRCKSLLKVWQESTPQGFGTVMVLSCSAAQIRESIDKAKHSFVADVIIDPSYPYSVNSEIADLIDEAKDTVPRIHDGHSVLMHRAEMTCAYIFGYKKDLAPIVGKFPLHP